MEHYKTKITDYDLRFISMMDPTEYDYMDEIIEMFMANREFNDLTKILYSNKRSLDHTVTYLFTNYPKLRVYIKQLYELYRWINITDRAPNLNYDRTKFRLKYVAIHQEFLNDPQFRNFENLFQLLDIYSFFLRPIHIFVHRSTYSYRKKVIRDSTSINVNITLSVGYTHMLPFLFRDIAKEIREISGFHFDGNWYGRSWVWGDSARDHENEESMVNFLKQRLWEKGYSSHIVLVDLVPMYKLTK